jgi:O-antigen/teichoic acid export membrane protein
VRRLIQRPDQQGRELGSAAALVAATTLIAAGLPLLALYELHGNDRRMVWIALACAFSFAPNFALVIEHALRAAEMARPIVVSRLSAVTAGALAKLALATMEAPIEFLALALVLESCLHAAMLAWLGRGSLKGFAEWRVKREVLLELALAGAPTIAAALVVTLFFRINVFLLERMSSLSEIAYYALAYNVLMLAAMVPNLALTGAYPRLVALSLRDRQEFERGMRWLYFAASVFGLVAFLAAVLVVPVLLPRLFGTKFYPSVPVVLWMCFALVFITSGSVRACYINWANLPRLHLMSAALGLLALTASALQLIPRYGAVGAGAAIAIGSAASAVASTWIFPALRGQRRSQLGGLLLLTPWMERKAGQPSSRLETRDAD